MILNAKMIVIVLIVLLLLFVFISPMSGQSASLEKSLNAGEALIWYLHHSGWAVKTQAHFLIFDYIEKGSKPEDAALAKGWIDTQELKEEQVFVFISHDHGDHFDPRILDLEKTHAHITYIFGWGAKHSPKCVTLDQPRSRITLGDMEIFTINHAFDNIPEAAFLVKVDGLVIFHSGDHGSTGPVINPIFKNNIDYLAQKSQNVDIAFISQFGSRSREEINVGDLYTINTMRPIATFPMHRGGGEDSYKKFAEEAQKKMAQTQVMCSEARGDGFFYGNGVIAKLIEGERDE